MANEDAERAKAPADEEVVEGEEERQPAQAAGARKPGWFARVVERCRSAVGRIHLPALDWRTFAWVLLALIVLAFIIRNWAPVRIAFFGWYLDAPRAVVFAIFFVLGVLGAWLWEFRGRAAVAREAEEAEEAEEPEEAKEPEEAEAAETEAAEETAEEREETPAWEAESGGLEPGDDDEAGLSGAGS
ncbi:MAG: LapA family protein [Armatimonadota bacterium]|nr:LapA family protein [Armatimonadota bacterium]